MKVSDFSTYGILVDEEDKPRLAEHEWRINHHGLIFAEINGKMVKLHRFILKAPLGLMVDHINHDQHDNRRANLRLTTRQQNSMNRRPIPNISGYKGVSLMRNTGRWRTQIKINGRFKHIGVYATPKEAALAYNDAAKTLFGDYAFLNVIKQDQVTV